VFAEVKKLNFPGPGTAMAFAAAVAAGAAGHSSSSCNNPWIPGGLIALSALLAAVTLVIELWSGPYYKHEQEVNASRLALIKKLPEMVKNKAITREECEK
jgi:hypothetical protein